MPPNKNQSNYSKRPIRKVRLLKIVPKRTKSLFEEYFYAFVAVISVMVIILGKAGGLSGYNAVVTGLWVGGFTWFAWMLRNYRKEQARTAKSVNAKQAELQTQQQRKLETVSPNFKPMIGPQWPVKTIPGRVRPIKKSARPAPQPLKPVQTPTPAPAPAGQTAGTPSNPNKPAFVYERPTLPDRKPKLPNNWPGRRDKKPKK
jgi:hypothetical protein